MSPLPNRSSRSGSTSTTIRSRGMTVNPLLATEAVAGDETEQKRNTQGGFDIFKLDEQNRLYYLHALGLWYRLALVTLVVFNFAIAFAYRVHVNTKVNDKCSKFPTFYEWINTNLRGATYIPTVTNFIGYAIVYNYASLYGGAEHLVSVTRGASGEAVIVPCAYIEFPRDQSGCFPVKGIRVTVPIISFSFVLLLLALSVTPLFLSFAGVKYAEYLGHDQGCRKLSSDNPVAGTWLGLALFLTCYWWLMDCYSALRHKMTHPTRNEYRKLFRTYTPTIDYEGNHVGGLVGEEARSVGVVVAALYIASSEALLFLLSAPLSCCRKTYVELRKKTSTKFVMDESDEGTSFPEHIFNALGSRLYARVAANKKVSWADIWEVVSSISYACAILYACTSVCYYLIFMGRGKNQQQVGWGYLVYFILYLITMWRLLRNLFAKVSDADEKHLADPERQIKTAEETNAEGKGLV